MTGRGGSAGFQSLGRLGGASRTSQPAAGGSLTPEPNETGPASRALYPLPESDSPVSAESPPGMEERPHARTLGNLSHLTPGAAGAFAASLGELVEQAPFVSRPLLPRTPANNAAAASGLGAEGDAQPAELGQPEAASSPPVEPAEAVVAEAEASERLAGEQDFEAEIAKEAEGAEEVEIAKEAEGAEEVDEMEEEEVRAPRRGEKVGQLG